MPSTVVQQVREQGQPATQEWQRLSTGIEARIVPVGASLIDDVVSRIIDPPVPIFHNPDKNRDEENPLDPAYQQALQATARRRATAAMETMLLFGLQLKEIPPAESWLPRLQLLERRGLLDLSGFDLEDPLELELVYKKYIAAGTQDLIAIGQRAGLNSRDVEDAARSFQSQP